MGRREVPQRELPALLDQLKERGATSIQRSPARFDGYVEVRWDESPDERRQQEALLRGWRQLIVWSVAAALAVALVIVLASL